MRPEKGSRSLRKGRVSQKGQYYVLTAVSYKRSPVFIEPRAADIVLSTLRWMDNRQQIVLHAAIVMPDHLHFIATLCAGTLSELVHSVKSFTANRINKAIGKTGKVWQAGYHDHGIRTDERLNDLIIYCLNNPVRAGMVNDYKEYPHWYCRYNV